MRSRPFAWLLCLLFGIVLTLPQVALGAWNYADADCQTGASSSLDAGLVFEADNGQAQGGEQPACTSATPVCSSAGLALASVAPRSLEPRRPVDTTLLHAPRERPERPPRA